MRLVSISLAVFALGANSPLAAANDPLTPYRGNIVAVGPDGQWSLNIYPAQDIFFQDNRAGKQHMAPVVQPRVMGGGIVQFASKPITVDLQQTDACKVGKDGFAYPLTVAVTMGKQTYKGCGFFRWDNELLSLIPAIDACLAKAPAKAPVTLARRESDGVMVRINDYKNGTTICQIDEAGPKPTVVKALTDKNAKKELGEEAIIFHRAPAKNPGGECYEATKVNDKSGKFLGWLDTNEGC
ncbi:MAG TPA: hypothetical protein DCL54_07890 [Alphaproteobacteria bacterium]|nr:hypothetical protein [Alphaproteobacteria bacterium]HAJ46485.1 hypothetical protein [Alphaproteobacteria bacterium]